MPAFVNWHTFSRSSKAMRFCMPDSRIFRQEYASLAYFFLILNLALEDFCACWLANVYGSRKKYARNRVKKKSGILFPMKMREMAE
jgi:hypothetical protein